MGVIRTLLFYRWRIRVWLFVREYRAALAWAALSAGCLGVWWVLVWLVLR